MLCCHFCICSVCLVWAQEQFLLNRASETALKWYHIILPMLESGQVCQFQSFFRVPKKFHHRRTYSLNWSITLYQKRNGVRRKGVTNKQSIKALHRSPISTEQSERQTMQRLLQAFHTPEKQYLMFVCLNQFVIIYI